MNQLGRFSLASFPVEKCLQDKEYRLNFLFDGQCAPYAFVNQACKY